MPNAKSRTPENRGPQAVETTAESAAMKSRRVANPTPKVTREAAGSFMTTVAAHDEAMTDAWLDGLTLGQLRQMAITLAELAHELAHPPDEPPYAGPDGICTFTADAAAHAFGTTREAIVSHDRRRAVTDARAVAMVAARRAGITLPAIAHYFDKDHTSVKYAETKISRSPRLHSVCTAIIHRLEEQYRQAEAGPPAPQSRAPRSEPLQLVATRAARRHHRHAAPLPDLNHAIGTAGPTQDGPTPA